MVVVVWWSGAALQLQDLDDLPSFFFVINNFFFFSHITQHSIQNITKQQTYTQHLKVQSKWRERGKDNKNTKVTPLYNHVYPTKNTAKHQWSNMTCHNWWNHEFCTQSENPEEEYPAISLWPQAHLGYAGGQWSQTHQQVHLWIGLGDVYQIGIGRCLQWNIVMDDDIGGRG